MKSGVEEWGRPKPTFEKDELLLLGASSERFSSAVISTAVLSGLGSFKLHTQ
jgi:hypothetical protein